MLRDEGYAFNESVGKVGVRRARPACGGCPGAPSSKSTRRASWSPRSNGASRVAGRGLRLSIDADLQRYVHQLLADTMDEAQTAAAVVMSPQTGEVYALVSVPTYDNNIFSLATPAPNGGRCWTTRAARSCTAPSAPPRPAPPSSW